MPSRIGPGRGQRPTWLDAVLLAALLGLAAWLGHSVATGFTYHWHWDRLLGYLVRTGPEGGWQANYLLLGLATTLRLALWGIVLASMLGLLLGLAGFARRHSLRTLARLYVGLMRNVPPVVFLFVFYFFVSSQLMPWLGIAAHVRHAGPAELTLLRWLFGDPALLENFLTGLV
ncbi:MAG: ABC transporter permease subunit, partial [Geminicoccaceae bacterium]